MSDDEAAWRRETFGADTVWYRAVPDLSPEHLADLWGQLREAVLPVHAELPWDILRVEIWSDAGRITVFPAARGTTDRIDLAQVQIRVEELALEYTALEAALDDTAFDSGIAALERRLAATLIAGARAAGLHHSIVVWSAGDAALIEDTAN